MTTVRCVALLVAVLVACSGDDKTTQSECDAIAADIRRAAAQRGIPSQGVCSSTNPTIQKDFGDACQRLKDCNDRCCK